MDGQVNGIRHPWPEPPGEGEATEVAEGVLWLRLPLPMKLDHVNVFALDDGADGWTIVDTGLASRRGRAIWQALMDGPLAGKPVSRVVVTHHHPDHVGLAGWFMERGARLWMPRTALLMARMLTLDVQETWPEETLAFYRGAGMREDIYEARKADRPFNFADTVHPIPLGYRRITQGEVVRMGGRDWTVRMGGGHAPEHATFWSADCNLVLGGDQLLPSISPNIGVYPTEPEADPLSDWLAACDRLVSHAREDHLVLPGHKLPFTGLPLRLRQLADNHHGALARLEAHLSAPRTAAECFMPIFKREVGDGEYGLALVEALAHCLHLWHAGRVRRGRSGDAWTWQTIRSGSGG
ncbi:MBL fold metallo-hydrolase [Roseovarius salinarum]|uniref:MBL fold metallo-hydrolase n=1 Tax=Roseovarius salinarum TaxID=1981892 RepID=UPI000C3459D9|nr:MBL fold metallo-hydrolase [Roseovarius salinarum]